MTENKDKTRRFKHWAYLNDEGRKLFGDIFENDQVPVLSMIGKKGPVGTPDNIEEFYLVQWDELTEEMKDKLIKRLCVKFNAKEKELLEQIEVYGLPLRRSLTIGSGTNHPGFFF